MHRCLQIEEVLAVVFSFIHDRITLYSLSRTCKLFQEPALNCLWRQGFSVVPLLKTFPRDVWTENTSRCLSFNRTVVSADWKRFKFYGDRVRDLTVGSGDFWMSGDMLYFNKPDETRIEPAVFRALSRRDALLPNLRSLRWWECKEIRLINIRLFLGPKLESFAIRLLNYGSDTNTLSSVLVALRTKVPRLESLEVSGRTQISPMISNALSELLCGLFHLQSLTTPFTLKSSAVIHLASLSRLQNLEIQLTAENLAVISSPAFPKQPFLSLQKLIISASNLTQITEFLEVFDSAMLELLDVGVESSPTATILARFFLTVQNHCLHTSLKQFHMGPSLLLGSDEPLDDSIITAAALRPLLAFSHMESLLIYVKISFEDVDNALLREMALAFPNLMELGLGSILSWGPSTRANLQCFIPFAQHCKQLRVIGLTLNATVVSFSTEAIDGYTTRLNVGRSKITHDVHAVASFLSNIFPNLLAIDAWDDHDASDLEEVMHLGRWVQVTRLIQTYARARRQATAT